MLVYPMLTGNSEDQSTNGFREYCCLGVVLNLEVVHQFVSTTKIFVLMNKAQEIITMRYLRRLTSLQFGTT